MGIRVLHEQEAGQQLDRMARSGSWEPHVEPHHKAQRVNWKGHKAFNLKATPNDILSSAKPNLSNLPKQCYQLLTMFSCSVQSPMPDTREGHFSFKLPWGLREKSDTGLWKITNPSEPWENMTHWWTASCANDSVCEPMHVLTSTCGRERRSWVSSSITCRLIHPRQLRCW